MRVLGLGQRVGISLGEGLLNVRNVVHGMRSSYKISVIGTCGRRTPTVGYESTQLELLGLTLRKCASWAAYRLKSSSRSTPCWCGWMCEYVQRVKAPNPTPGRIDRLSHLFMAHPPARCPARRGDAARPGPWGPAPAINAATGRIAAAHCCCR